MSDSLFLPRELFTASAKSTSSTPTRLAPPTDAVLDDLRRIARHAPPAASFGSGQKNRRLQPRDLNSPKVDLWLDLSA